jgi:NitT/TauT family transport system ATP-binding protein
MKPTPDTRMDAKIQIRQLGKTFGRGATAISALEQIELAIGANEFVTLVGASGCGKSTLLRLLAGLDDYSTGRIEVNGAVVHGPSPQRAMVFQHYSLYPWLDVMHNIKFSRRLQTGRENLTSSDVEIASGRADALLALMGLTHVAGHHPDQLSGGMQQRVAIARALMGRPDVLLMDEPFGALDAQTREVMHDLIRHVYTLEKATIVFVTHDVEEAIYLGQRVVVMAPRPGRIDSIYDVPLPAKREQDMKHAPEFLALKKQILARIRETSGMKTDFDMLEQLSRKPVTGASA